jgi:hypothetical protein
VGCGGSKATSTQSTPASSAATAAAPATASPGPLKLTDRVIRAGEFPGFSSAPGQAPAAVRDVSAWLAGQGGGTTVADAARLRRLRFVAGVREDLTAPGVNDRGGLSLVEQFRTHAAAAGELAAQAKPPTGVSGFRAYAVPGIPGARGFGGASNSSAGTNVVWADGPFYYLVGAGSAAGAPHPPTDAQVIAAATVLYRRVHGRGG